jgi:hypothetical protein
MHLQFGLNRACRERHGSIASPTGWFDVPRKHVRSDGIRDTGFHADGAFPSRRLAKSFVMYRRNRGPRGDALRERGPIGIPSETAPANRPVSGKMGEQITNE